MKGVSAARCAAAAALRRSKRAPSLTLPRKRERGQVEESASRLLRQQARIAADGGGVDAHDLLQREAAQVVRAAGLGSGAGKAGAAERLGADHRPDHVAVDIDVAG